MRHSDVTKDQLSKLRQCKLFTKKFPIVVKIAELISDYNELSTEYSFDPQKDRAEILYKLHAIHNALLSPSG